MRSKRIKARGGSVLPPPAALSFYPVCRLEPLEARESAD
jgi:hypothetical protein